MTEKQWISFVAPLAVNAMQRFGYRASVLIAQSCQETGYGQTDLAQNDIRNVLGMKEDLLNDTWQSNYWYGECYVKKTPEWINGVKTTIEDSFRVYASYQQCFYDYCQFMRDAKRDDGTYKYRDVLGIADPAELIEEVRKRGYCTDPEYSKAVVNIIKKWNLTQYDEPIKEEKKIMTLAERLMQMGVALIDRIKQNFNCGQKHNANTHRYLAIHYLGVNGENPDLYDGCYGGHFYVSKNGTCYQAADVGDILWHVGASSKNGYRYIHEDARNQNTIGIECATFTASGHNDDDETWYYTIESQQAMAKLAAAIMMQYNIKTGRLELRYQACLKPDTDEAVVEKDRLILVLLPWDLGGGGSLWMNSDLGMMAELKLSRNPETGEVDMEKTLEKPTFNWRDNGGARKFSTDSFLLYYYDTDDAADSPYYGQANDYKFAGGNNQLANLKTLTKK